MLQDIYFYLSTIKADIILKCVSIFLKYTYFFNSCGILRVSLFSACHYFLYIIINLLRVVISRTSLFLACDYFLILVFIMIHLMYSQNIYNNT